MTAAASVRRRWRRLARPDPSPTLRHTRPAGSSCTQTVGPACNPPPCCRPPAAWGQSWVQQHAGDGSAEAAAKAPAAARQGGAGHPKTQQRPPQAQHAALEPSMPPPGSAAAPSRLPTGCGTSCRPLPAPGQSRRGRCARCGPLAGIPPSWQPQTPAMGGRAGGGIDGRLQEGRLGRACCRGEGRRGGRGQAAGGPASRQTGQAVGRAVPRGWRRDCGACAPCRTASQQGKAAASGLCCAGGSWAAANPSSLVSSRIQPKAADFSLSTDNANL